MIYLELFLTFLQVGAFSFGGGYGMISLIRERVLAHGWLCEEELLNMIAVAESTPGPIAVNMATFVGSSQGGFLGALLATIGVVLPSFIIILLISVPSIVLALMLQYVFCFKLAWFPLTMSTSDDYFTWEVFRSMIPAVFALCLSSIAGYARYTRAELSEVLTGEFMLLARTKGLTKRQAISRHAMRNSMVVIFPSILSEFISVLSGSLIIEQMFGINGVGGLYLNSITFQDYDFFMLLSGFYTLIGLAAGIVIDISYGFIDPRIRMGAK